MRRLKTDRVYQHKSHETANSLYTLSAECRTPTSSCFLNDTSSQTMNFVFKSWHPSSSLLSVALQQPYKVESFVLASSEGMSINSTKEKHNTTKTKKRSEKCPQWLVTSLYRKSVKFSRTDLKIPFATWCFLSRYQSRTEFRWFQACRVCLRARLVLT